MGLNGYVGNSKAWKLKLYAVLAATLLAEEVIGQFEKYPIEVVAVNQ